MYGVPAGKSEAGRTEWNIDIILPLARDMTIVAAVRRSLMTARDEAKTVIGGKSVLRSDMEAQGGVAAGVG